MLRKTVHPSAMGTISGDLTLSNAAALGYYGIELKAGRAYLGNGGFQVEEYKKPEYEVRVTPEQKRVIQGEPVKATIEGQYYFGEPVAGRQGERTRSTARATGCLITSRTRARKADVATEDDDYDRGEQQGEQTGKLDAQGQLTVTIPDQCKASTTYATGSRRESPTRPIARSAERVICWRRVGSYFVHIEPITVRLLAGRAGALPRRGEGLRRQSRSPSAAFTVDLLEHELRGRTRPTGCSESVEGSTGADGSGRSSSRCEAGSLVARVRSKTPEGREVEDSTWLWVSGGGFDWGGGQSQRVEIIPDKKSYKGGDTARLLIVTGVPDAWVWVTAEGRSVHDLETRQGQRVERHGRDSDPFRLRAQLLRHRAVSFTTASCYQGAKSVKVPPVEQQMEVAVKASKAQYKPGEQGVFTIDAKDWQGTAGEQPSSAWAWWTRRSTRFGRSRRRTSRSSSTGARTTRSAPSRR